MLHMMLNVVFGGTGVGLTNMLIYVILAVFICGFNDWSYTRVSSEKRLKVKK